MKGILMKILVIIRKAGQLSGEVFPQDIPWSGPWNKPELC
jgi:hypothetical protein